jgi:ABC-type multidrug transport system fused ATPase/permease subunit
MVEGFGKLLEVINNYVIAHQYGNLDLEVNKLERSLTKLNKSFTSINHAEQNTAMALSLVAKLGFIGTAAYSYFNPPTPDFWVNDFMLFGYYILRSTTLAEQLPSKINALFTGLIDTKLIVDFFKKESAILDSEHPIKLDLNEAPSIEFQNVCFNYGEGKPGLSNINFTVKEGQKIAIMGPTGSGKSTLLKLLQRFYSFEGEIRINDIDITQIKKDELRSYLSIVSQDTNLINDTLLKNIGYGDRNANEEELFTAAKYAKLNLERERFFADVKKEGSNFSGGEKQRANIARALLKPKSFIFLLDEPTSSLDQQTAKEVHEVLDQLTKNVTTIMVTHDPYAVMYTDLIVYMEQGKILEQGTFNELMTKKGAFYSQFVIQCDKLGIAVDDIKPSQTANPEDSSEFLAWREARRSQTVLPLLFSTRANTSSSSDQIDEAHMKIN